MNNEAAYNAADQCSDYGSNNRGSILVGSVHTFGRHSEPWYPRPTRGEVSSDGLARLMWSKQLGELVAVQFATANFRFAGKMLMTRLALADCKESKRIGNESCQIANHNRSSE
jgi:hypothetical protein